MQSRNNSGAKQGNIYKDPFNLMSFFKSLAKIINVYQDNQASYFALYTIFNFIYEVDLRAPNMSGRPLPSMSNNFNATDMEELTLVHLDFQLLTSCLIKSDILKLCLMQPAHPNADEDLMRISLKLVITIVFKSQRKRMFFG